MTARRAFGLAFVAALALSCGGGGAAPGAGATTASSGGGGPRGAAEISNGAVCGDAPLVQHPSHTSTDLTLELRDERMGREGITAEIPIPPFEFEVTTRSDVSSPVEMELTIHDPTGRTHVQRFTYVNMQEQCDPYCLPVRDASDCPPRRCWMERSRPPAQRIDHTIYRGSMPGTWTYVLHRLDNDDRVSVARQLFEGATLEGEACEALPLELGGFRRTGCQRGVVPMGVTTNFWGIKAQYVRGSCRANAFALPIDHQARTLFDEGPYGAAPARSFPEGTVHEVRFDDVTGHAWLAHHHLYVFAARDGLPGYDGIVRGMLEVFPVVDGPVRRIPSCAETGAVTDRTIAPPTMAALRDQSTIFTHFEGNRPSGAWALFHDQHPLALAGLRRHEIIHSVDGVRLNGRRDFDAVLARMTRPGRMELVVSRARVRHARCIRLTLDPSAAPAGGSGTIVQQQPPPPPPPVPGRGRHCERRTDQCWVCADIAFPAEIGCRKSCRRSQVCVTQHGQDLCLPATRVCCLPNQPCDTPPGCDGAASSCSAPRAGAPNDHCTFLSACPPMPSP